MLTVNTYPERYFAPVARLLRAFYARQPLIEIGQTLFSGEVLQKMEA